MRLYAVRLLVGWVPPFVGGRMKTNLLRLAGVRIGAGSSFWDLPELRGVGKVQQRLTVGARCGFNKGCVFDLAAPIVIGDDVEVGHDVMFLTSAQGGSARTRLGHDVEPKPITIGNGVWLGARATIMPGVTVGAGSVIGAGVTVNDAVPENTLLTGAPPISIARWR
jgi:maltose O-acetyltransferase